MILIGTVIIHSNNSSLFLFLQIHVYVRQRTFFLVEFNIVKVIPLSLSSFMVYMELVLVFLFLFFWFAIWNLLSNDKHTTMNTMRKYQKIKSCQSRELTEPDCPLKKKNALIFECITSYAFILLNFCSYFTRLFCFHFEIAKKNNSNNNRTYSKNLKAFHCE